MPTGAVGRRARAAQEGVVMTRETRSSRRRWRAEHGTSAVEYALIIAGCAVALMGGVVVLNGSLRATYEASAQGVESNALADASTAPASSSEPVAAPSPSDVPSSTSTPTPTPTPTSTSTPTPTPTPTSASPKPTTRPKGSIKVDAGDEADSVDIGANDGSKGFAATVDPEDAGYAYLDKDDELVFEASTRARSGTLVTVTWSYAQGSKVYSGTTTYWID
jgi:Flp pilus assembly pilin Flp